MSLTTKFIARIVAPAVVVIAAAVGISGCFKIEPKPSEKVVQDAEAARLAAQIAVAKAESLEKIAALTLNGGKIPPAPQQPSPAPSTDSIPVIDGRNMTPITLQDGQCVTARWVGNMPQVSAKDYIRVSFGGLKHLTAREVADKSFTDMQATLCSVGGVVIISNRRPE